MSTQANASPASHVDPQAPRIADAIYQNNQLVARAIGAEVDLAAREIRFREIYNSDYLLLPHECEFGQFTIMVQRIGLASKIERGSEHKGRVLKDVVAEILRKESGDRSQKSE
ncbi:MAG: hypothetical protein ACLQOO_10390 [Terriglobia bacterium]